MRFPLFWNVLLLGAMLISGCAATKNPTKDWDAKRFYDEAQRAMADERYDLAIKRFEGLEAHFPYGRYAQQAQLEIIYAYFKDNQGPLAIEAADRFIRLHPAHPHGLDAKCIFHGGGRLKVFEHELATVYRCYIRILIQIESGHVDLVFGDFIT